MKNILDELYDCGLFHLTEIIDDNDDHKKAMDRLHKAESEMLKAFPDCKALLDEYQSAECDLSALSNGYEFCKGFRVGAQLILEILRPIKRDDGSE